MDSDPDPKLAPLLAAVSSWPSPPEQPDHRLPTRPEHLAQAEEAVRQARALGGDPAAIAEVQTTLAWAATRSYDGGFAAHLGAFAVGSGALWLWQTGRGTGWLAAAMAWFVAAPAWRLAAYSPQWERNARIVAAQPTRDERFLQWTVQSKPWQMPLALLGRTLVLGITLPALVARRAARSRRWVLLALWAVASAGLIAWSLQVPAPTARVARVAPTERPLAPFGLDLSADVAPRALTGGPDLSYSVRDGRLLATARGDAADERLEAELTGQLGAPTDSQQDSADGCTTTTTRWERSAGRVLWRAWRCGGRTEHEVWRR